MDISKGSGRENVLCEISCFPDLRTASRINIEFAKKWVVWPLSSFKLNVDCLDASFACGEVFFLNEASSDGLCSQEGVKLWVDDWRY